MKPSTVGPASSSWLGLLTAALFSMSSLDRAAAAGPDEYTRNAVLAIEELNSQWYNVQTGIWDNAWWNSANALTTLAEFTLLRLDEANRLNLGGYMYNTFVQAQRTNVQTLKITSADGMPESTYCLDYNQGCMAKREFLGKRGFDDFINEFYDDEGWWALGLIRTYDATADRQYLDAAVNIFEDMQTGLGGPCGGGIYWNKDRRYVNAITNELYLFVAAALARRIPDNPSYLETARNQWAWFDRSGMINDDNLINDGLDGECRNNGLQTWSYNQGVILGALTELWRATGNDRLLDRATTIARAAIDHLANGDGVLVETDRCELRDGHCGRDGQQFKGIFVRNLRYLHNARPRPEFRDFIVKNADVIWANNRNDENQLGVAWNGPFVLATGNSHSSALDVLVAAISVA
ncbi:glycosyl hydrolase family 76-domain-containing protein [Stachybotrys elegans]|uniref:Glycosyl hydrolase family 76-domain-containing protein n=1 Tax=Stachybotrys elegans TaxID=80388 RepID=A0A8K0WW54_9HYPO|nr:glycosyl hydrolase family 76-domain-containing protein [Stachybotrys elegans]